MCLRRKILPKLENVPLWRKFFLFEKTSINFFFIMKKMFLGEFWFFFHVSYRFLLIILWDASLGNHQVIVKKNAILLFFIHFVILIYTNISYKIQPSLLMGVYSSSNNNSADVRRLAVTQIPVKNHQQTLMWKTLNNNPRELRKLSVTLTLT